MSPTPQNSKLPLALLVLAFAMLWIPLGQHVFLVDHWMKVGTFMASFLLFVAFHQRDANTDMTADLRVLSIIMLVLYIIHQFEEHWIDLFGNTYAFQEFLNITLRGYLDISDPTFVMISQADIFMVNTSLVWLTACVAILCAPGHIFPSLATAGIILVNAISHTVSGISEWAYNPGLLTSLILFFPFAIWFYQSMQKRGLARRKEVIFSMIWAVFAHVILIGGLMLTNYFNAIPSAIYYLAMILWSIIPAFIFRTSSQMP